MEKYKIWKYPRPLEKEQSSKNHSTQSYDILYSYTNQDSLVLAEERQPFQQMVLEKVDITLANKQQYST